MQPCQDNGLNECFTLHPRHICFVYSMVDMINKTLINFVPLCEVKVVLASN